MSSSVHQIQTGADQKRLLKNGEVKKQGNWHSSNVLFGIYTFFSRTFCSCFGQPGRKWRRAIEWWPGCDIAIGRAANYGSFLISCIRLYLIMSNTGRRLIASVTIIMPRGIQLVQHFQKLTLPPVEEMYSLFGVFANSSVTISLLPSIHLTNSIRNRSQSPFSQCIWRMILLVLLYPIEFQASFHFEQCLSVFLFFQWVV